VFVDHSKTNRCPKTTTVLYSSIATCFGIFDHHRAINTILQDAQMCCVGPDRFRKEITE